MKKISRSSKIFFALSIVTFLAGIGVVIYHQVRVSFQNSVKYIDLAFSSMEKAEKYLRVTEKVQKIALIIIAIAVVELLIGFIIIWVRALVEKMKQKPMAAPPVIQNQFTTQNNPVAVPPVIQNQYTAQNIPVAAPPVIQNQFTTQNNPVAVPPVIQNQYTAQNDPVAAPTVLQNQYAAQNNPVAAPPVIQNQYTAQNNPVAVSPVIQNSYPQQQNNPVAPTVNRFCMKCGSRLVSDSKFCPVCGNKII